MSDTRNLHQLQCLGMLKRASTDHQLEWLRTQQQKGIALTCSKLLIIFERKFFLPRKQALKIISGIA